MKVTLLHHTADPLQLTEYAASVCYDSEPTEDGKITKACFLSGHESVLEHVSFTWEIEGISRACMAQLTRSRIASFSVQSQRYVDQKNSQMVIPEAIAPNQEAMSVYMNALATVINAYDELTELGIPKEDARFILPNANTTKLVCTMNLREFIHFCNLRLCRRAQWEIRRMCQMMADAVNEATDNVFKPLLVPVCERSPEYPFCPESGHNTCGLHPTLSEIYNPNVAKNG